LLKVCSKKQATDLESKQCLRKLEKCHIYKVLQAENEE